MSDRAEVPTKPAAELGVGGDAASEVGGWLTEAVSAAMDRRHHLNTVDLTAHVAAALAPLIEARVREARAEAWDETAEEACGWGWLHDWALADVKGRNPYRDEEAS